MFTVAVVYLLTRAANAIPEFRTRVRLGDVVQHDVVQPSPTFLTEEELFSFSTMDYVEHFPSLAARATEQIARAREHPTVQNVAGTDDLLYMTAIPWVSFIRYMHPLHLHHPDCVHRFAWGKTFEERGQTKMPPSVQGHHTLLNGFHMERFNEEVQGYFANPRPLLVGYRGHGRPPVMPRVGVVGRFGPNRPRGLTRH